MALFDKLKPNAGQNVKQQASAAMEMTPLAEVERAIHDTITRKDALIHPLLQKQQQLIIEKKKLLTQIGEYCYRFNRNKDAEAKEGIEQLLADVDVKMVEIEQVEAEISPIAARYDEELALLNQRRQALIDGVEDNVLCPICQSSNKLTNAFCIQCGTPLR